MVYELWTKEVKTGKKIQLSGTFKTKSAGMKHVNRAESNKTNYVVGRGRGFPTKKEAVAWKKQALKNPPFGVTREQYDKGLPIHHKPALTKLFLKKKSEKKKKYWK